MSSSLARLRALGDNELVFSYDQLVNQEGNGESFKEDDLLEKDEQYYFSREPYFSSVTRGVVELDDKVFKIYTQSLLHYKRTSNVEDVTSMMEMVTTQENGQQLVTSIYLNKNTLIGYVEKQFTSITDQEVE